jgi:hypothetical protein
MIEQMGQTSFAEGTSTVMKRRKTRKRWVNRVM